MKHFPFNTRLLSKDQPTFIPEGSEISASQSLFSSILLGSPGETLSNQNVTAKVSKDGGSRSGLQGVLSDLMLARAFLIANGYGVFECLHGMRLFKSEVQGALSDFFKQPQPQHFVIYFSGHGNRLSGNWVFTDGEVSLDEVYTMFLEIAPQNSCLSIVADCCHSGAWVEQISLCPDDFDKRRFAVQAACLKDEVCWDTRVGGLFTKSWVSGDYYKITERQLREHSQQIEVGTLQSNFKASLTSWLPWNRFLANNPALLACSLLAASSLYGCSRECSQLLADSDLENAQHPIATHPFAFNLTFHDSKFAHLARRERFPSAVQCQFIDIRNFWLGSA
eukprot:c45672_g1_i1.p1 GENE.c45672_g1_i1~~c45672_g1_i1.p1  ORF type:complete len:336 (+),score=63.44 c45672_g1_i1:63-1070(+)